MKRAVDKVALHRVRVSYAPEQMRKGSFFYFFLVHSEEPRIISL